MCIRVHRLYLPRHDRAAFDIGAIFRAGTPWFYFLTGHCDFALAPIQVLPVRPAEFRNAERGGIQKLKRRAISDGQKSAKLPVRRIGQRSVASRLNQISSSPYWKHRGNGLL